MNTHTNAAAATAEQFHSATPDADLDFEIQTRLGRLSRAADELPGGEPIARALTHLQRALADCDIVPIDQAPALAPLDDLPGESR